MLIGVTVHTADGSGSQLEPVAEMVDEIDRSGFPYQVTAMETVVEGSWFDVMPVIHRVFERLTTEHSRVFLELRIDEHRGAKDRLHESVKDVDRKLGHAVVR